MADFTFDLSDLAAGLEEAHQLIIAGAGNGLSDLAERILTEAKAAAPKDSGDLVGSGTTAIDYESLEAAVGFGSGDSAVNAVVQHERMDYHHDDGGPKYLEIPFVAVGSSVGAAIIGAAIEAQL